MNDKRPVNLDLTTISLPAPAIASILHRLSGVVIFLFIPILLWILSMSLASIETFQTLQQFFTGFLWKFILWAVLTCLLYHLVAGIRHLLMDMHIGESRVAGKISAYIVFGLGILFAILIGIWLW